MADDTEKLAEALHHILSNYEGDEGDKKWKAAKEALDNLQPRSMHLPCPKCKILHVDEKDTPHKKHICKFCGARWEPHSFPTFGKGVSGMEAREGTSFLNFAEGWLWKNGYPEGSAEAADVKFQMGLGWMASREHWKEEFKAYLAKTPVKARKSKKKKDPKIVRGLRSGKMTLEDVEGLGLDPKLYEKDVGEEDNEKLAEEIGIDF